MSFYRRENKNIKVQNTLTLDLQYYTYVYTYRVAVLNTIRVNEKSSTRKGDILFCMKCYSSNVI